MASDIEAPTRVEPIFDEFGQFTTRYAEFFAKSGVSINESSDEIDAIELDIAAILIRLDLIEADIVAIKARLDVLEALVFIQITATANHTTTRNEIITCTNTSQITVSLNATPNTIPAANEECHVTATEAAVVLSGNGKLINGLSSITIRAPNSRNVIYNSTADAWFIR